MLKVDIQLAVENTYSKDKIKKYIMDDLSTLPEITDKCKQAVELITDYMNKTYSYTSKNDRLSHLVNLDLESVVDEIVCAVMGIREYEMYTSIVGKLAPILKFPDLADGVKTIAEILAVVCETDLYDIVPANISPIGVIVIKPNYILDEKVFNYIDNTMYLPPMVSAPQKLTCNTDSAYLTIKRDALILGGRHNQHDGNIRLDSLNKFNSIPLSLDENMLRQYSEEVPDKIVKKEDREQYIRMIKKSYTVYAMLVQAGNEFHLPHKPDKRGRIYSQGYHVSTQGNSFKKAIINLHQEEIIEG